MLGFVSLEISIEGQNGKAPAKWCNREELQYVYRRVYSSYPTNLNTCSCKNFCLDEKGDRSWRFDITATFFGRFTRKWQIYNSKGNVIHSCILIVD